MRHAVTIAMALVFVGVAPAAAQQAAAAKPPVMPHDTAGRAQCLMCHGGAMQGIKAAPASHEGRTNQTCGWCHLKGAAMQTTAPPAMAHAAAGREQCLMCHGGAMEGIKAVPADHKGRTAQQCGMCHKPKAQ